MDRLANKAAWDDAVKEGKIVRQHEHLVDDGSLQCDRQLLLALGVAKEDKMLFHTKTDNVEDSEAVEAEAKDAAEVAIKTEEHSNASEMLPLLRRNRPEWQETGFKIPEDTLTQAEVRAVSDRLKNKSRKLGPQTLKLKIHRI